jgi:hypothetical protein
MITVKVGMGSKIKNLLVLILITQSSNFALAKTEIAKPSDKKISAPQTKMENVEFCKKVNLPDFKVGYSLPALKSKFDSYTHLQLTQYLWYLVLSKKPSKLAVPLLQYLANSQSTNKTNAYYSLLAVAIGIKNPLYDEVQKWPHVTEPETVKTTLRELCDRYYSATEGKVNE